MGISNRVTLWLWNVRQTWKVQPCCVYTLRLMKEFKPAMVWLAMEFKPACCGNFCIQPASPNTEIHYSQRKKGDNTKVSLYRSQVSAGRKECHGWLEGWRWPREGTRSKWNSCKKCKAQTDSHSRERRPVGREEVGTTCVLGLGLTVTSPCWQQCPFCSVTWHAKWNYTWLRRKREFIGSSNWKARGRAGLGHSWVERPSRYPFHSLHRVTLISSVWPPPTSTCPSSAGKMAAAVGGSQSILIATPGKGELLLFNCSHRSPEIESQWLWLVCCGPHVHPSTNH